jgi:hypothetical protein
LIPKEAFENYRGFLGHLLANADWGAIWPAGDQIPLRQRTTHLHDHFGHPTAHKQQVENEDEWGSKVEK